MSNAKQQPADELFKLITGHWAGQITHAGFKLGVFEALFSRAGMKLAGHHEADDQLISVVEGRTA